MSKIGHPWIVGVYTAIAFGIFLFIFWRDAFFGIGTSNLIVMFVYCYWRAYHHDHQQQDYWQSG